MLVSQLGSHWGLWFGSSIISLVEILELILDVIAVTGIVSFGFLGWISAPDASSAAVSRTSGDATTQPIPCDHGQAECPTKTSSLKPPNVDALLEPRNDDKTTSHFKPCDHDGIAIPARPLEASSWSCDSCHPRPGSKHESVSQDRSTLILHSSLSIPSTIKDFVDMEPTGRDRDLELGL